MIRNLLIGVGLVFLVFLGLTTFGLVRTIFQMSFFDTIGLLVAVVLYGTVVTACYVVGNKKGKDKLVLVGHVLTLIGIFAGWCYLAPLWAHTYAIHSELGGWGNPLFYLAVLIGGPLAVGLFLVLVLNKPPKTMGAFVVVAAIIVLTGLYQGSRQSGLRDPLTRNPIFAFCPGDAKIMPGTGELPWGTTHIVSQLAVGEGCHFHPSVHTDAIVEYDQDEVKHRTVLQFLEQIIGLRIGDSVNEMRSKRARAAVRMREWLRENGVDGAAGDDDSAAGADADGEMAGGYVHSAISDDPAELVSAMPRVVITLLIAALLAVVGGPLANHGFGLKWHGALLPGLMFFCVFFVVAPAAGWLFHGNAWWAFASRKGDVVEMDRLHQGQVVQLGWQDYNAADTTQQWWVAYLGDPDCTPVLEQRGACTQEVCLQVLHGSSQHRWVTPAEVEPEQRCFRPGDLGHLTTSGSGTGVMSVRVYSGGGKAVFGPPEWLRRRLQQRSDEARAAKVARVGGLGPALTRSRCVSGMFDRSGGYPRLCGQNYRPLHNP